MLTCPCPCPIIPKGIDPLLFDRFIDPVTPTPAKFCGGAILNAPKAPVLPAIPPIWIGWPCLLLDNIP